MTISLALTGDVMLGRTVNKVLRLNDFSFVWGNTLPILEKVDLRLVNLECVISDKGKPVPKVFNYRAHPDAIKVLKRAKIDYVSLANNHTLDYGEEAFVHMLDLLSKAEIPYSGGGRNIQEATTPAVLKAKKVKFAIVSFTDNEPTWEATETEPGIFFIPLDLKGKYLHLLSTSIKQAREEADIVITSAHMGWHYRTRPEGAFLQFAHKVIELGADVYWSHSNHIPQGIEIYKDRVILHNTGDFIDDYAIDQFEYFRNDQSFIFILNFNRNFKNIELIPVLIDSYNMQVNVAEGKEFEIISDSMVNACRELGAHPIISRGKIIIK